MCCVAACGVSIPALRAALAWSEHHVWHRLIYMYAYASTRVSACGALMVQVLNDGSQYKRPWFGRRAPRPQALLAMTWSGDSFQLATLDANHVVNVWWLRPQQGALRCAPGGAGRGGMGRGCCCHDGAACSHDAPELQRHAPSLLAS